MWSRVCSPVAEDRRLPPLVHLQREDRDHAGLALGVLARAVDVGEPQRDRRDPVEALVEPEVELGRHLALPVLRDGSTRRPRQRQVAALALAVDRAPGRGEDDAPNGRGARASSRVDRCPRCWSAGRSTGSSTERCTCGWAARWKTTSGSASSSTRLIARSSVISSTTARRRWRSRRRGSPACRSKRLSTIDTSSPRSSSASARCEPMNPLPPVMRALIRPSCSASPVRRRPRTRAGS